MQIQKETKKYDCTAQVDGYVFKLSTYVGHFRYSKIQKIFSNT